jgi:uncharacterized membrane protein YgdD (TMEM256/DUF423 family)
MHATIRTTALMAAAVAALVAAGVAASVSAEFKQHATTAGIVLLGLIALSGILAALILRRPDHTAPLTPTAQRPPAARQTSLSGHHTGSTR